MNEASFIIFISQPSILPSPLALCKLKMMFEGVDEEDISGEDALLGCDEMKKGERNTEKERSTNCVRAAVTYRSPSLMGDGEVAEIEGPRVGLRWRHLQARRVLQAVLVWPLQYRRVSLLETGCREMLRAETAVIRVH